MFLLPPWGMLHVNAQPLPRQLGISSGSLGPFFSSWLEGSRAASGPQGHDHPSKGPTDWLAQFVFSPNISYLPTQLQEKGVYKAMSEFDIFINYIETYMTMKMKKWNILRNKTSRVATLLDPGTQIGDLQNLTQGSGSQTNSSGTLPYLSPRIFITSDTSTPPSIYLLSFSVNYLERSPIL